jgi:hypothetical protein
MKERKKNKEREKQKREKIKNAPWFFLASFKS